ncbi:MAG: hypothetical protein QM640_03275 [Niabella sp.]
MYTLNRSLKKLLPAGIAIVIVITLGSFSFPMTHNMISELFYSSDTIPSKSSCKIEELNEALAGLERAKSELSQRDIEKEVTAALKKIDMEKINEQVRVATANLRPQIQQSVNEARQQIEDAKKQIEHARQQLNRK